jgi:hypothetical protein
LCDGLRSEAELPVVTVRGPATARADGAAVVTLESEGEVEPAGARVRGRPVIDLFGAMGDES